MSEYFYPLPSAPTSLLPVDQSMAPYCCNYYYNNNPTSYTSYMQWLNSSLYTIQRSISSAPKQAYLPLENQSAVIKQEKREQNRKPSDELKYPLRANQLHSINKLLKELRSIIPNVPTYLSLSKIQILNLIIDYIKYLKQILHNEESSKACKEFKPTIQKLQSYRSHYDDDKIKHEIKRKRQ